MFVGHFAIALGAKRTVPDISLGALVAATFLIDLLWPVTLIAGLETVRIDPGNTAFTALAFEHYPITHSLLMSALWALLAGGVAYGLKRNLRLAVVIATLTMSHWVLDFITHAPDLPVAFGDTKVGLGLWNSIPATIAIEGGIYALALWMYLRQTRAKDSIGTWAFASLACVSFVIWISQPWSPPPPNASAVAYVGLAMLALPIWAHWADKHRSPASENEIRK